MIRSEGLFDLQVNGFAGVDFNDAASLALEWLENRLTDDVDAADVEADHACSINCPVGEFGVDFFSHVGGSPAGT